MIIKRIAAGLSAALVCLGLAGTASASVHHYQAGVPATASCTVNLSTKYHVRDPAWGEVEFDPGTSTCSEKIRPYIKACAPTCNKYYGGWVAVAGKWTKATGGTGSVLSLFEVQVDNSSGTRVGCIEIFPDHKSC